MNLPAILRYILRTPYQSASAALIMTITFFMMTLFLLISIVVQGTLTYFETKPKVIAFYPNNTPEDEILQIKQQIELTGKTREVKYISSKEAVNIYKETQNQDEIGIDTEFINESVLPPSLEISAKSIRDLKELREVVAQKEGVKIAYLEKVVDTLSNWLNGVRVGGGIILALLALESVLVVWTIIGLRISQRKEEMEILNLLGATRSFIVKPFHIEGMLYGFIGSLLGVASMMTIFFYTLPAAQQFFKGEEITMLSARNTIALFPGGFWQQWAEDFVGIPLSPVTIDFMLLIGGIMILFGTMLGLFGSMIATTRYRNDPM